MPPIEATRGRRSPSCRATTRICSPAETGLPPADSHEVGWIRHGRTASIFIDGTGRAGDVWCGFLGVSSRARIRCSTPAAAAELSSADDARDEWLDSSMRFLAEEQPSPEIVARLAELFLAQAIRDYMETTADGRGGWLRGLRRPGGRPGAGDHPQPLCRGSGGRGAGARGGRVADRARRALRRADRRAADALLRALADADRGQHAARRQGRIPPTSPMPSASTARRRSTAPSSANMASRRRPGGGGSRPRSGAAKRQPTPSCRRAGVRYCTAHDGTRLAYSVAGEGPPLVKTANWLNHIEHDWRQPAVAALDRRVHRRPLPGPLRRARQRPVRLGHARDLSFDAFVEDLASVVDALELEQLRPAGDQPGRGGRDRLCRPPPGAGPAAGHLQRLCRGLGGARPTPRKSPGARR